MINTDRYTALFLAKVMLVSVWVFFSGCAWMTRNTCEKVNWFERGQSLALKGQYPANDTQLKQCRKVKADIDEDQLDLGFKRGRDLYCHPERAFITGKEGQAFATDICDQSSVKGLLRKHAEGVRAFCAPASGKQLGASGAAYNTICPSDLEAPFKTAYSKARKGYLQGQLPGLNNQIDQKRREINQSKNELMYLEGQRVILASQLSSARSKDPMSSRTQDLDSRVDTLENQIRNKQNAISSDERAISELMGKISVTEGEIAGLGD